MENIVENIYNLFKDNALIHSETQLNGDFKLGNKAFTKIKKIYQILLTNEELKKDFFNQALLEKNPYISIWVDAFSLALGYEVEDAKKRLGELAKRKDISILSLNAEYTIKEYNKNGCLKF